MDWVLVFVILLVNSPVVHSRRNGPFSPAQTGARIRTERQGNFFRGMRRVDPAPMMRRWSCRQRKAACFGGISSSTDRRKFSTLPPVPNNAHRFVLMRHGESEFNNANIFTGWCDVALTQRGVVEAVEAGQVFASHQLTFRKCIASMLTRSIVTAHRALEAAGVAYTPIQYDWRLNERHYGALQGLSKDRTAVRLGRSRVMKWRRSYVARPPMMTRDHPHFDAINNDPRYRSMRTDIPLGESLQDCQIRVLGAWKDILAEVRSPSFSGSVDSDYTLLVAHANTIRALVMHLDDIPAEQIEDLNIPTGIPFYYDIDKVTGKVAQESDAGNPTNQDDKAGKFRGAYISDAKKERNFLERRRAANDPWLWALWDHQVTKRMLGGGGLADNDNDYGEEGLTAVGDAAGEGLEGIEAEAKANTELFMTAPSSPSSSSSSSHLRGGEDCEVR